MAMRHSGLAKLSEESGELQLALGKIQQTIGKLLQYPELQLPPTLGAALHPDGTNLRECLQNEMGDVMAALDFVKVKLDLDERAIIDRWQLKMRLFNRWDSEP
jgi:hypothetical protein